MSLPQIEAHLMQLRARRLEGVRRHAEAQQLAARIADDRARSRMNKLLLSLQRRLTIIETHLDGMDKLLQSLDVAKMLIERGVDP